MELFEDCALVDALIDHFHVVRVRALADSTSGELVQHEGESIEYTFEAEDPIGVLRVDWAWIIVNFLEAGRIGQSFNEEVLERGDEFALVNGVVTVDENGKLEG